MAQFSTLVTRSAASATYSPGGVQASTLYRINQQGLIQASSSPTDVAIDGNGFFVVNSRADGSGEQLYTRAGSFEQDFLGNLVNDARLLPAGLGARRQRADHQHQPGRHGQRAGDQRPRRRDHRRRARRQSERHPDRRSPASMRPATWRTTPPPAAVSGVQPHMVRSVQVFDSLGGAHNVQIAFLKDAGRQHLERRDLCRQRRGRGRRSSRRPARQRHDHLQRRRHAREHGDHAQLSGRDRSAHRSGSTGSTPAVRPTARSPSTSARSTAPTASASSPATTTSPSCIQNGAEVGELNGVTIDDEGFVIATFTNGATQKIYRLPLATFANPLALDPRTGNVFAQTAASGEFNLRSAGEGGAGTVVALGARGRQCRSGRRVHQNDRHPARLFSQCACHHNG